MTANRLFFAADAHLCHRVGGCPFFFFSYATARGMQAAVGARECALLDLPPEILSEIVRTMDTAVDADSILSLALSHSSLYAVCTSLPVDGRVCHACTIVILPSPAPQRNVLSILDAATHHLAAVNATRRKRILYRLKATYRLNAIKRKWHFGMGWDPDQFSNESLLGLEAWVRSQPLFIWAAPPGANVQRATEPAAMVPLDQETPDGRGTRRLFGIFPIDLGTDDPHTARQAAKGLVTLKDDINREISSGSGPKPGFSIYDSDPHEAAQGPKCVCMLRGDVCTACGDGNLWTAYPGARIYLVKADSHGRWIVCIWLPL